MCPCLQRPFLLLLNQVSHTARRGAQSHDVWSYLRIAHFSWAPAERSSALVRCDSEAVSFLVLLVVQPLAVFLARSLVVQRGTAVSEGGSCNFYHPRITDTDTNYAQNAEFGPR